MKRFVLALLLFIPCLLNAKPIEEINIRDPFIVADETTHTYYLYCSSSVKGSQGQSIGGVAAVLSQSSIKGIECVEYPELGMEAIWKIDVEDFPAFILVDDKGNDFFKTLKPWTPCAK